MRRERKRIVRFYDEEAVYFVTSKTQDNRTFFEEGVLGEVFIENLKINQRFQGFDLYAFCLLPDHFHLLLKPAPGPNNISRIMKSFKENVSRDLNNLIFDYRPPVGVTAACPSVAPRLPRSEGGASPLRNRKGSRPPKDFMTTLRKALIVRYRTPWHHFPKFQWQKSFYDHIIRNDQDFERHWNYTAYNFLHHGLAADWKYTSLNYQGMVVV